MKLFSHVRKNPPANASRSWLNIVKNKSEREATIYIYDEITYWGITSEDVAREIADLDVDLINLRINSPGGWVFDGVAIYNLFKSHKAEVHVFIDGLAASIASIIAMAGDKIYIAENAMFMIHKPFVMASGNSSDLRKSADLLDQLETVLVNTYLRRTDKINEAEILAFMEAETWFDSTDAVDFGFADEVLEGRKEAAKTIAGFDFSGFSATPKRWLQGVKASKNTNAKKPVLRNLIEHKIKSLSLNY